MTVSAATGKTFTRDEANRTLPLVRLIVRDIVEMYADLQSRAERLDAVGAGRRGRTARENDPYLEEVREMQAELLADEKSLEELISELSGLGVELQDASSGAVVFRGQSQTRYEWRPGDVDVRAASTESTLNLYSPPATEPDNPGLAEELR